jgi:hypothetical protein
MLVHKWKKHQKGGMKRKIALKQGCKHGKLSIKSCNLGQSCEELPVRAMQKFGTEIKGTMQR